MFWNTYTCTCSAVARIFKLSSEIPTSMWNYRQTLFRQQVGVAASTAPSPFG